MDTVKVRIAVAVDAAGSWNSCGSEGMDEDDMMALAVDCVGDGEARYWVTAYLQIPKSIPEVAGEVEDDPDGEKE